MARAQTLETVVLLARRDREIGIAMADCLIGIKVLEVASIDEALSYLQSRSGIRLVVTDIDIPGCLSGLDLARFVTRQWPHIGIIVLEWPTEPTPSLPQAVTFLSKPCPPGALVEQVRATLPAFSRPS